MKMFSQKKVFGLQRKFFWLTKTPRVFRLTVAHEPVFRAARSVTVLQLQSTNVSLCDRVSGS